MDFSEALEHIKDGDKLRRKGWGYGAFVFLVPGSEFQKDRHPLPAIFPEDSRIRCSPHINVCIGDRVSVWDAQTMDILAEDWEIYE